MGRIIRVRFDDLSFFEGVVDMDINQTEGEVYVRAISDKEFTLYATSFEGKVLPLFLGRELDQKYHFEGDVTKLTIVPATKTAKVALKIAFSETSYRGKTDPVPKVQPLPVENITRDQMLLRSLEQMLDARFPGHRRDLGHDYGVPNEGEDEDDEFGQGYTVPEDIEEDIDNLTREQLIDRLQRRRTTHAAGKPVFDDNSKPDDNPGNDDKPEGGSPPGKPGDNQPSGKSS